MSNRMSICFACTKVCAYTSYICLYIYMIYPYLLEHFISNTWPLKDPNFSMLIHLFSNEYDITNNLLLQESYLKLLLLYDWTNKCGWRFMFLFLDNRGPICVPYISSIFLCYN